MAKYGLLKGILCTPNVLAKPEEYKNMSKFAKSVGARYVLMNPLASMGRGLKSRHKLSASLESMNKIRHLTSDIPIEMVYVRFPNEKNALPLTGCSAGRIFYVFSNGETTVCPYLTFATKSSNNHYEPEDFLVGNILKEDIVERLEKFNVNELTGRMIEDVCRNCDINTQCQNGCPAAVIASGENLNVRDKEMCPQKG